MAKATIDAFLSQGDIVSLISRSNIKHFAASNTETNISTYLFDLNNLEGITDLFKNIINDKGVAKRICFFQRFRGEGDPWAGEFAVSLRATSKFINEFKAQPLMEEDRSIVIISSPADKGVVLEQSVSYHVAKAGLSQMIRYYAVALGPHKIRVNGIKPAIVLKPRAKKFYDQNPDLVTLFNQITPLGRMGFPTDIANAVLFMSSESASYITGQILCVDGGLSVHENASLGRLASSVFKTDLKDPRWEIKQD
ncbi:MAG: SDR family oxidoreductase [Desulfobacteraceae bacterium]|nr:SDR family oxidoreductase [Desulfobacteraceae bacterium]